jgi:hypothetical protein
MSKHDKLLAQIESEWPTHIARGLGELVRNNLRETIYAAAFWQFYCDYTIISPPAFGANAESDVADGSDRWLAVADWKWDVLKSVIDGMTPLYLRLSDALSGAPDAEWDAVIDAHYELIPRVARSVTRSAQARTGSFADIALPGNFLVFATDIEADASVCNRLVRASIDEAVLPTLDGILWPED